MLMTLPHCMLTADGADPWAGLAYAATIDVAGTTQDAARIDVTVAGFTLSGGAGADSILGRAIVFHNGAGARVGCGLITPADGAEVVQLYPYPGYTPPVAGGPSQVQGTLLLSDQSQVMTPDGLPRCTLMTALIAC